MWLALLLSYTLLVDKESKVWMSPKFVLWETQVRFLTNAKITDFLALSTP